MCRKLLFTVLLLLVFSSVGYSQGWQSAPGPITLSETQRNTINQSLMLLQTELQNLKQELTATGQDCQMLRLRLTAAASKLQEASALLMVSQTESARLKTQLTEQGKSLLELQAIFNEYEKKALIRITAMEAQRNLAAGAGLGGIILAFILGAVLL